MSKMKVCKGCAGGYDMHPDGIHHVTTRGKLFDCDNATTLSPAPAATVTDAKECECCEFQHGISSFIPAVFCGLCKHPILNPAGERLYASFEAVDAWQQGRRLPAPPVDAVTARDEVFTALVEVVREWSAWTHTANVMVYPMALRQRTEAALRSALAALAAKELR